MEGRRRSPPAESVLPRPASAAGSRGSYQRGRGGGTREVRGDRGGEEIGS
jgi:hypothetical protein